MLIDNITTLLLTAGALGTAAFGFVEAFKWWRFGEYGYDQLVTQLGALKSTLAEVYSPTRLDQVLRTLYRGAPDDLARSLRQGIRAGLTVNSAALVANELPILNAQILAAAATAIQAGVALTDEQRSVIGQYELAADARIDGALAVAQNHYAGKLRLTAALFAIVIALVTATALFSTGEQTISVIGRALLIGVLAVPVAPIVHDLVNVLKSVASAIGPRT